MLYNAPAIVCSASFTVEHNRKKEGSLYEELVKIYQQSTLGTLQTIAGAVLDALYQLYQLQDHPSQLLSNEANHLWTLKSLHKQLGFTNPWSSPFPIVSVVFCSTIVQLFTTRNTIS
jgi:hypothetical protein